MAKAKTKRVKKGESFIKVLRLEKPMFDFYARVAASAGKPIEDVVLISLCLGLEMQRNVQAHKRK